VKKLILCGALSALVLCGGNAHARRKVSKQCYCQAVAQANMLAAELQAANAEIDQHLAIEADLGGQLLSAQADAASSQQRAEAATADSEQARAAE